MFRRLYLALRAHSGAFSMAYRATRGSCLARGEMHCGVTLSYQFLPYLPSWVPVTKTHGSTPIPYPLAPDRESCRVSQSPIDFMACQSLPCPVDSIAQCGISLPQEVGGSTLPSLLL